MTSPITGIDHVVIGVRDLDRAEAAYRRLGFVLSPRALHSAAMGTANHTIMLAEDYFELLAVQAATERNIRWREAIAAGEGVAGIAAAIPNAAAARAAWQEAGLSPGEVVAFSRPVDRPGGVTPGGVTVEARFETVSLPKGTLPALSLFACGHLTRDAVWLPELMSHPNSAVAVRRVTIAASDPVAVGRAWASAFPGGVLATTTGGVRLRLKRHAIDVLAPAAAAERYRLAVPPSRDQGVALEFAVRSLATCRSVLTTAGLAPMAYGEGLAVGAEDACGAVIVMMPEGAPL